MMEQSDTTKMVILIFKKRIYVKNENVDYCLYYVTFPDLQSAQTICHKLLEEKLIACSNIFSGIHSQYWWNNKIESSQEAVGILKSLSTQKNAIELFLNQNHPYENYCLLQIPISGGSDTYLNWLFSNLKK